MSRYPHRMQLRSCILLQMLTIVLAALGMSGLVVIPGYERWYILLLHVPMLVSGICPPTRTSLTEVTLSTSAETTEVPRSTPTHDFSCRDNGGARACPASASTLRHLPFATPTTALVPCRWRPMPRPVLRLDRLQSRCGCREPNPSQNALRAPHAAALSCERTRRGLAGVVEGSCASRRR